MLPFEPDPYILFMAGFGLAVLAVSWLPLLLRQLPLSLPILCVAFGFLAFAAFGLSDEPHPLAYPEQTERLTEFVVIISLMGVGLKISRPLGYRGWQVTWRLLAFAMPLCIAAMALLGWGLLGLAPATALLLGAALAPTEPVLAADVQLGPPGTDEEDEVRFALTSEAGLNDGLAFPFTNLAIAVAIYGTAPGEWFAEWFIKDVVWKIAVGILMGYAVGKVLGAILFRLPENRRLAATGDSLVALAATLISYSATELAHGYGFLAVFITALVIRQAERSHEYSSRLHDFAEQIERLLMMMMLVLFGGAIATGLLCPLTWPAAIVSLVFLFLVRPLTGWLSLAGLARPRKEKAFVSFFGIRGLGSFYYLAYALNHEESFQRADLLWATVGFIVLVSILVHGVTVTPIIQHLDRVRRVGRPFRRQPAEAGVTDS